MLVLGLQDTHDIEWKCPTCGEHGILSGQGGCISHICFGKVNPS